MRNIYVPVYRLNAILLGSLQSFHKTCSLLHGKNNAVCNSDIPTFENVSLPLFLFLVLSFTTLSRILSLNRSQNYFVRDCVFWKLFLFVRSRKPYIHMYRVGNNASRLQYFRMVKCILSILTIIVISFLFLGWLVGFRAKENSKISRLFFSQKKKKGRASSIRSICYFWLDIADRSCKNRRRRATTGFFVNIHKTQRNRNTRLQACE